MINTSMKSLLPCNCRKKHECTFDGKCRAQNIVYKCVVSIDVYPNKVYTDTAESDFKQRFYNHRLSFNNEAYSADTAISKHVWETKKFKIIPSLRWSIIKSVPAYSNICMKCQLCLQEKTEFLITLTQTNCLIKDQSLFQSAATLASFYCRIIYLMIRTYGKCIIRCI